MTGSGSVTQRAFAHLRRLLRGSVDAVETLSGAFEEVDLEAGASRELYSSGGLHSKFLVVITTCNRPGQLQTLLDQIISSLDRVESVPDAGLLILEDAAEEDYAGVRLQLARFQLPCLWVRSRERMGKRGYWRTYQAAFSYIERSRAERILFLQDDLSLADDFFDRTIRLFSALKEEGAARPLLLNCYSSSDDEPHGRWVKFTRRPHANLPLRRTQWFDLNGYLIDREVLGILRFRLAPIRPSRWEKDPTLSSGVGQQMTIRLTRRVDIFQCFPPLIFHGRAPSVMNPEARRVRNLDNYHLREAPASSELSSERANRLRCAKRSTP